MRRLIYLFLLLISVGLTGCLNTDFDPTEWALEPELEFSKSTILFHSSQSSDTVTVFTNYNEFEVVSSAEWCLVDIDRESSMIEIQAQPNFGTEQRSAEVTITISRGNKTLSKDISVVQMGGVWESIGNFNVYWSYRASDSQREAVAGLLRDMVYVEGGTFIMGDTEETIVDNATPHPVTLSPFHIGKYEVTQGQWRAIMGYCNTPAKGENLPVYQISWAEAMEFVARLSELTHLDIFLPTEAQWEFAAKGGIKSLGFVYAGSYNYEEVAVFDPSGSAQPMEVGTLLPNELGIYDMSGNVSEFISDWYVRDFVDPVKVNPTGPATGTYKGTRGGCLNDPYYWFRVTNRNMSFYRLTSRSEFAGFRIVIIDPDE